MRSAKNPSICNSRHCGFLLIALLGLCGLSTGCGETHATAPIRGKVTLVGRPIGPGFIVLEPESATGDYSLPSTTVKFGDDGTFAGRAPVGKHKVIIQSPNDEELGPINQSRLAASQIPLHYSDPAVSQLTAQVTTDGENELVFDLKPFR